MEELFKHIYPVNVPLHWHRCTNLKKKRNQFHRLVTSSYVRKMGCRLAKHLTFFCFLFFPDSFKNLVIVLIVGHVQFDLISEKSLKKLNSVYLYILLVL